MDNVIAQITYLLNPTGLYKDIMDRAEDWHKRLFAVLFWIGLTIFVGWLINLASGAIGFPGLKKINILIVLAVDIAFLYFLSKPNALVAIGAIGAIDQGIKAPLDNAKLYWEKWFCIICNIILWYSFIMLAMGTIPLNENPLGILPIILGISILALIDYVWAMKTKIAKKLIYYYVIVIVILSFMAFIPRAVYIKAVGWYPLDCFEITETDKETAEIDELLKDNEDKKTAARLKIIKEKIRAGQATEEEIKFFQELKSHTTLNRAGKSLKDGATSTWKGIIGIFGGNTLSDAEKIAAEDGYYSQSNLITPRPGGLMSTAERQELINQLAQKTALLQKACQYTSRYRAEFQEVSGRLEVERMVAIAITEKGVPGYERFEKPGEIKPFLTVNGSVRFFYVASSDFIVTDNKKFNERCKKSTQSVHECELYGENTYSLYVKNLDQPADLYFWKENI